MKTRQYKLTYGVWYQMIKRCTDPTHHNSQYYLKRGITVCDRWKEFKNFVEDMGLKPDGLSIDRIDNDKGYYKDNCRWVTQAEQNTNTRMCIYVTVDGEKHHLSEWARLTGMSLNGVKDWHRKGQEYFAMRVASLRELKKEE